MGSPLWRALWRWVRPLLVGCLLLALGGCMLTSGEQTTIDLQESVGNISNSFVGAEGSDVRSVAISTGPVELQVIAILDVESGDLQVELVQPDGSVAFTVASRPDAQVTRSGRVRSDDQGQIRYRISARGAREGSYQLFFQP